MAAVQDSRDDAASIASSVPNSNYDSDSEPDDDMNVISVPAPITSSSAVSAKVREAQAETARAQVESARARQIAARAQVDATRAQQMARDLTRPRNVPAADEPSTSNAAPQGEDQPAPAAAHPPEVDPDDVPPPPYSEALRHESRPDDNVRHAWRQGITEGSLDMNSFNRLVSPTVESDDPTDLRRPSDPANHPNLPELDDVEAQLPQDERRPLDGSPVANYGSIPTRSHGNPETEGVRRGGSRGYRRGGRRGGRHRHHSDCPPGETSDETSDPSEDELEERRQQRKSGKGGKRWCGGWGWGGGSKKPRWMEENYDSERRQRRLKKLFIIVLLLLCFVAVIETVDQISKELKSRNPDYGKPGRPGTPGGGITDPGFPGGDMPNGPNQPGETTPGDPSIHRDSFCKNTRWTRFLHTSLNKDENFLSLIERLNNPRFTGVARIIAAPDAQEKDVVISIAYAVPTDFTISNIGFSSSEEGLLIANPTFNPDPYGSNGGLTCVDVDLIISVKRTAILDYLYLSVTHLGIFVDQNIFDYENPGNGLVIKESTHLETTSGRILAGFIDGRNTTIVTQSGRVTGRFSLYDNLKISTASGGVNVEVEPQPAPKDNPSLPAVLSISTYSGRVTVKLPKVTDKKVPNRDYQTSIHTSSGGISGNIYAGSDTRIASYSGRFELDVQPFVFEAESDSKKESNNFHQVLRTETTSSGTHLKVLEPFFPSGRRSLLFMNASHTAYSGSIDLLYPHTWSGAVSATAVSGSLDIKDDLLEPGSVRGGYGSWPDWKKRFTGKRRYDNGSAVEYSRSSVDVENVSGHIQIRWHP